MTRNRNLARGSRRILGIGANLSTGATAWANLGSAVRIPGGLLGAGGMLLVHMQWEADSLNGNQRFARFQIGSTTFFAPSGTSFTASIKTLCGPPHIIYCPTENSQVSRPSTAFGTSSGNARVDGTLDMTVDQYLQPSGYVANSGDTITLDYFMVEAILG